MKKLVKYTTPVYLPKCDYCGSNVIPPEKFFFVSIEGKNHEDVRVVHRQCYAKNQSDYFHSEYLNSIEEETE